MSNDFTLPKSVTGMTLRGCDNLIQRMVDDGVLVPVSPGLRATVKEVIVQPMFEAVVCVPILRFQFPEKTEPTA